MDEMEPFSSYDNQQRYQPWKSEEKWVDQDTTALVDPLQNTSQFFESHIHTPPRGDQLERSDLGKPQGMTIIVPGCGLISKNEGEN